MYICTGCGAVFREDVARRVHEPHGESIAVCPACGDTPIEAQRCACGTWHDPEDLYPGGYCPDCLAETLTRARVAAYITEKDQWAEFLIDYRLGGFEPLITHLLQEFCAVRKDDQEKSLRAYMLDSAAAMFDYACWLHDRAVGDG